MGRTGLRSFSEGVSRQTASLSDRAKARELVLRHGWNTTCYQVLNPGIELWFSSVREGMIGFVLRSGVRVVAGAPICAVEDLDAVVSEWEEACSKAGQGVCYFGAEDRLGELLRTKPGYSRVALGAQPVWSPASFLSSMATDASLRYQRNRARNKGIWIQEWPVEQAVRNESLQGCLAEWLRTRGLPPLHFLVEPYTLDDLLDRRLFVAELNGKPVGFVVLTPIPSRRGWLTEQFVRGRAAPNGCVELALSEAIRATSLSGDTFVTMGIVPLSDHGSAAGLSNPAWLRLILRWVRAHGRRFYNFDGLDRFKSKFHPESWEPIYVISREPKFSPRTLHAILSAFSEGSPALVAMRGLGRAMRQELSWLRVRHN